MKMRLLKAAVGLGIFAVYSGTASATDLTITASGLSQGTISQGNDSTRYLSPFSLVITVSHIDNLISSAPDQYGNYSSYVDGGVTASLIIGITVVPISFESSRYTAGLSLFNQFFPGAPYSYTEMGGFLSSGIIYSNIDVDMFGYNSYLYSFSQLDQTGTYFMDTYNPYNGQFLNYGESLAPDGSGNYAEDGQFSYSDSSQSYSITGSLAADSVQFTTSDSADVPEPSSWTMFVGGFGAMGATMRRKKATVSFA